MHALIKWRIDTRFHHIFEAIRHVRIEGAAGVRVGRNQETQQQVVFVACGTRLRL